MPLEAAVHSCLASVPDNLQGSFQEMVAVLEPEQPLNAHSAKYQPQVDMVAAHLETVRFHEVPRGEVFSSRCKMIS
jgi:hypothetical protein